MAATQGGSEAGAGSRGKLEVRPLQAVEEKRWEALGSADAGASLLGLPAPPRTLPTLRPSANLPRGPLNYADNPRHVIGAHPIPRHNSKLGISR